MRSLWTVVGAAAVACASASPALAQDADERSMMEQWLAQNAPGEEHEALDYFEGEWRGEMTWWAGPDGETTDEVVWSEQRWIMGGRFIEDTIVSESEMGLFRGRGVVGYDKTKGKYVSSWIDNMSTSLMTGEGTYDSSSKTFTFHGESPGMDGEWNKTRDTLVITGQDSYTYTSRSIEEDGTEWKAMEIKYTRIGE